MNDTIKAHLFSFGVTFVSTFLLTFGASLQGFTNGNLTMDIIISLVVSAARTAGKLVLEDWLKTDVKLGVAK